MELHENLTPQGLFDTARFYRQKAASLRSDADANDGAAQHCEATLKECYPDWSPSTMNIVIGIPEVSETPTEVEPATELEVISEPETAPTEVIEPEVVESVPATVTEEG